MKKINIGQLINKKVRIKFVDSNLEEGWLVKDKYHERTWSVQSLNYTRKVRFRELDIKTITLCFLEE